MLRNRIGKCHCLSHYRRHILDIIPAVASHRALRFLRHKMERQELTSWEVTQTVLVALHSSTPTRDVMEEATVGFSKRSQITHSDSSIRCIYSFDKVAKALKI